MIAHFPPERTIIGATRTIPTAGRITLRPGRKTESANGNLRTAKQFTAPNVMAYLFWIVLLAIAAAAATWVWIDFLRWKRTTLARLHEGAQLIETS
ncbi:MAG TPA: hypothetical protein VEF54_00690, partial [archaeon]|nr:hypothetical protein [archaeon]